MTEGETEAEKIDKRDKKFMNSKTKKHGSSNSIDRRDGWKLIIEFKI